MEKSKFQQMLSGYSSQVESALERFLPKVSDDILTESMRYSLFAGGKRLRPVLTLAWCDAFSGALEAALPAAAAVEMIHTYSLIHDDLPCMDNDVLRRGKPTNHTVYGEDIALLAGSGLYGTALETVLNYGAECGLTDQAVLATLRALCHASGRDGILSGQVLDMKNTSQEEVDRGYLERVNDRKTASMLQCACEIGCISAAAPPSACFAARKYGLFLGRAFQIRDDILDVISTSEQLGKTPGKDREEHKCTFVSLLGLDQAQVEVGRLTDAALEILETVPRSDFLRQLTVMLCSRET